MAIGSLAFHVWAEGTNEISWSGTATNAEGKVLADITVNTSETPDLEGWGKKAGELCAEWYPKICALLDSDGFTPHKTVQLRFRKEMRGVAATSQARISISANYVRKHTNDWGMVVHELTHIVQAYGGNKTPGWLVEGIADYVRIVHYEPKAPRPRINPEAASYRDAYKTTAMFLEWVEKTYDRQLVKGLNAAARQGKFEPALFKEHTGKTVDELWDEFVKPLQTKKAA